MPPRSGCDCRLLCFVSCGTTFVLWDCGNSEGEVDEGEAGWGGMGLFFWGIKQKFNWELNSAFHPRSYAGIKWHVYTLTTSKRSCLLLDRSASAAHVCRPMEVSSHTRDRSGKHQEHVLRPVQPVSGQGEGQVCPLPMEQGLERFKKSWWISAKGTKRCSTFPTVFYSITEAEQHVYVHLTHLFKVSKYRTPGPWAGSGQRTPKIWPTTRY